MTRYLSLDWIKAVSREVASDDALAAVAAGDGDAEPVEVGVTQVVTGGPEGDVCYHLQVGGGAIEFAAGPADPEHVRMEQSWETAVSVATGALSAQDAFINGRILFHGDQQRLVQAQPVFGALDSVFTTVGRDTDYA